MRAPAGCAAPVHPVHDFPGGEMSLLSTCATPGERPIVTAAGRAAYPSVAKPPPGSWGLSFATPPPASRRLAVARLRCQSSFQEKPIFIPGNFQLLPKRFFSLGKKMKSLGKKLEFSWKELFNLLGRSFNFAPGSADYRHKEHRNPGGRSSSVFSACCAFAVADLAVPKRVESALRRASFAF